MTYENLALPGGTAGRTPRGTREKRRSPAAEPPTCWQRPARAFPAQRPVLVPPGAGRALPQPLTCGGGPSAGPGPALPEHAPRLPAAAASHHARWLRRPRAPGSSGSGGNTGSGSTARALPAAAGGRRDAPMEPPAGSGKSGQARWGAGGVGPPHLRPRGAARRGRGSRGRAAGWVSAVPPRPGGGGPGERRFPSARYHRGHRNRLSVSGAFYSPFSRVGGLSKWHTCAAVLQELRARLSLSPPSLFGAGRSASPLPACSPALPRVLCPQSAQTSPERLGAGVCSAGSVCRWRSSLRATPAFTCGCAAWRDFWNNLLLGLCRVKTGKLCEGSAKRFCARRAAGLAALSELLRAVRSVWAWALFPCVNNGIGERQSETSKGLQKPRRKAFPALQVMQPIE